MTEVESEHTTALLGDSDLHNKRFTEEGNANRFVRLHGHEVRYCHPQNTWYLWNKVRWSPDKIQNIVELGRDVVTELYAETEDLLRDPEMKKAASKCKKFTKGTDTLRGLSNMVKLASSKYEIAVAIEQMDCKPNLFNAFGKTIDLSGSTPLIRTPDRDDMITKVGGCTFDLNATAPRWHQFINEIFDGDQDLIDFVHKAVGYSLGGSVREKCFFFCFGEGSNGKTVFLNTIRTAFGEYGQQASIRTFLKKRNDSEIRDDLVNLKGARFVTAVEPDDNARFDMEVMKPLSGNDPIRCRTLHQRQIEFVPEAKLWIAGNNKPTITETNIGTWDRVRLIPFTVSFIGHEDRALETKLLNELPGILNWILEGYTMYRDEGLDAPKSIKEATEIYKVECNSLLTYLEYDCIKSSLTGVSVRASVIYERYKTYCQSEGMNFPYSNKRVKQILRSQGIEQVHTRSGEFYMGICPKDLLPGQVKIIEEQEADAHMNTLSPKVCADAKWLPP